MRFLTTMAFVILGAAAFLLAVPGTARADVAPGGAAGPVAVVVAATPDAAPVVVADPGTDDEAREYAMRENASPEVGEFVGGDCGVAVAILILAVFVVLVLFLSKEGKI